MSKLHPDLRNFLRGALGYLAGAAAGFLFIFIVSRLGLVRWLSSLVDESQDLVRLLAILVLVGLMIALGGAILGGLGGRSLGSILGLPRKRRQVIGSGIAFGLTIGALTLVFLLLIGFIGNLNDTVTDWAWIRFQLEASAPLPLRLRRWDESKKRSNGAM